MGTYCKKLKVDGYEDVAVRGSFSFVMLKFDHESLAMTPKESKRLRKALKRAEERVR